MEVRCADLLTRLIVLLPRLWVSAEMMEGYQTSQAFSALFSILNSNDFSAKSGIACALILRESYTGEQMIEKSSIEKTIGKWNESRGINKHEIVWVGLTLRMLGRWTCSDLTRGARELGGMRREVQYVCLAACKQRWCVWAVSHGWCQLRRNLLTWYSSIILNSFPAFRRSS